MPHNPRVSYGVAGLIRGQDGKILMLHRKSTHAFGRWSVPGGWVDMGESPELAIDRELQEEIGVKVLDKKFFRYSTEIHNEGTPSALQSLTLYFSITRWEGEPVNREPEKCFGLQWIEPMQALEDPSIHGLLFPGLGWTIRQAINQLWA